MFRLTVLSLLLLVSGCVAGPAMMGSSVPKTSSDMIMTQWRTVMTPDAYTEYSTFISMTEIGYMSTQPVKCIFSDVQINKKVASGEYVYYGKCDEKGMAEGQGSVYAVKSGYSVSVFNGAKDRFPVYVGNFKAGKREGKGYLTRQVKYSSIVEFQLNQVADLEKRFPEWRDENRNSLALILGHTDTNNKRPANYTAFLREKYYDFEPASQGYYPMLNQQKKNVLTDAARNAIVVNIPYYLGDFKDDKMQGNGTLFDENAMPVYVGEVVNGIPEGKGKIITDDYYRYYLIPPYRISSQSNPIVSLTGDFTNRKANGTVVTERADCTRMVSEYKNNVFVPGRIYIYKPTLSWAKITVTESATRRDIHIKPRIFFGMEAYMNFKGWMQPSSGPAYLYTQDDDNFYVFDGYTNSAGEMSGEGRVIIKRKKFSDLSNNESYSVNTRGSDTYTARVILNKGNIVKEFPDSSKYENVNEAFTSIGNYVKLLQGATPLSFIGSADLGKGLFKTAGMSVKNGDFPTRCYDMEEFSNKVDNIFERAKVVSDALKSVK